MKRLVSALALAFSVAASSVAFADGAIICRPESTGKCKGRQYCCYKGGESDGDAYCKALGCARGGTSSCPTAANVSSCGTRDHASSSFDDVEAAIPWCVAPQPTLAAR